MLSFVLFVFTIDRSNFVIHRGFCHLCRICGICSTFHVTLKLFIPVPLRFMLMSPPWSTCLGRCSPFHFVSFKSMWINASKSVEVLHTRLSFHSHQLCIRCSCIFSVDVFKLARILKKFECFQGCVPQAFVFPHFNYFFLHICNIISIHDGLKSLCVICVQQISVSFMLGKQWFCVQTRRMDMFRWRFNIHVQNSSDKTIFTQLWVGHHC